MRRSRLRLARGGGNGPLTAYLATSPGGADAVAIIAASSRSTFPSSWRCRSDGLLIVILIGPGLARMISRWAAGLNPGPQAFNFPNESRAAMFNLPWYVYLLQFVAGLFLANGVPHFVQGISGHWFQTPFASPPGVGESSPVVNVLWGFFNLAVGFALLFAFCAQRGGRHRRMGVCRLRRADHRPLLRVAFRAGAVAPRLAQIAIPSNRISTSCR